MSQRSVKVRLAVEADINFIFSSWLKSHRVSDFFTDVCNDVYFTNQHKVIEKILKNPNVTVNIACEPNDPANILAWIAYEKIDGILCVHYVYVKHTFRKLGLCRALLEDTGHDFKTASIFTHQTRSGKKVAEKFDMVLHPYILFDYTK